MTAAISISLLVIASAAAYGAFTFDSVMTAKTNQQVQVTNYSAEIDTLKPQINSLSNNMTSLGTVKSDITDIKGKLTDLETKLSQAQQDALASQKPAMTLDRSSYFQGDTIHITAIGVDQQQIVQIQLVDVSGNVIAQKVTSSDYNGIVMYDMPLSSTQIPGNFQVKLIAGEQVVSIPITIMISSYSGSVTLSGLSYLFTAQTDKTIYQAGDVIEVSGVGIHDTGVTGVLTSPSGRTMTSHTTVQSDGTYELFYADSQPFETGNWSVAVHNQGLERIIHVSIVDNSNQVTFTASPSKTIYQVGDMIWVAGIGKPYSTVITKFTSPSGSTYTTSSSTGSNGYYVSSYSTLPTFETGIWHITLNNQGQVKQISVFVESSTSSSGGSSTFTAQTDKTVYKKGDQIFISGSGKPYTAVHAILISPSGKTYDTAVSAGLDGSYSITYPTSSTYETGNWYISLTNQFMAQVVSIFLEP
ncbi:MAG TPA: hypothetical protein VFP45_02445 [Candidatus Nitrosotalea sp.]|nr:hypothetical protein [Candidatus Nitrosotalea sp.]